MRKWDRMSLFYRYLPEKERIILLQEKALHVFPFHGMKSALNYAKSFL